VREWGELWLVVSHRTMQSQFKTFPALTTILTRGGGGVFPDLLCSFGAFMVVWQVGSAESRDT